MKIEVSVKETSARIKCGEFPEIVFQTNKKIIQDRYDFVIWAILPIAMRKGGIIDCDFSISKETLNSAKKISQIWSSWLPEIYSLPIFSSIKVVSSKPSDKKNAFFFSGGIDSTYSALRLKEDGIESDAITIHGMDYRYEDNEKFNKLIEQTNKFRRENFNSSVIVKTNLYTIYAKVGCNPFDGHITHIFSLFASGSLFDSYKNYFIAADYRLDQQYEAHPYGSNTATNSLMLNGSGALITRDDDVTRSFKVGYLGSNNIDLSSISICTNYKFRPKNCGLCEKCIRSKVMFYAKTGTVPEIFQDKHIPEEWYLTIDVKKKIQSVFMADVLDSISRSELKEKLNYNMAYKYWREAAVNRRLEVRKLKNLIQKLVEKIKGKADEK